MIALAGDVIHLLIAVAVALNTFLLWRIRKRVRHVHDHFHN